MPAEIARGLPVELRIVDELTPEWAHARALNANAIAVRRGRVTETLVAHELVHIMQWRRIGWSFPIVYAHQVATFGYWDAPLEVEARRLQGDAFYLAWARDLIREAP